MIASQLDGRWVKKELQYSFLQHVELSVSMLLVTGTGIQQHPGVYHKATSARTLGLGPFRWAGVPRLLLAWCGVPTFPGVPT